MAPEQGAKGVHQLLPQSDVFALGVIIRQMFGHLDGDKDLDAISGRCTADDPSSRYGTAKELLRDLERYRRGDDVLARPLSLDERAWRVLRRHPALALAGAIAVLSLVLGLAGTSWQWQRAERQAERTRQLAALMAAAFPTATDTGYSARNAVAWLRDNLANDPVAERELLTAFRESLIQAGKTDVVAPLLGEIVDQLGAEERRRQVRRLAAFDDRDNLAAAALIGIARNGISSQEQTDVVRKLTERFPDDELSLFVAALTCNTQSGPCEHAEYFAKLVSRYPNNAVYWLLRPHGQKVSDEDLAGDVAGAAAASTYDDRMQDTLRLVRDVLRDQPVPPALALPIQAIIGETDAAATVRSNAVASVSLPIYASIVKVCQPDSSAMNVDGLLRSHCLSFGRHGFHSQRASILSRMVCSVIIRRLSTEPNEIAEAKEFRRQYLWLQDRLLPTTFGSDVLSDDVITFGEWEAVLRAADRQDIARQPPSTWLPADPTALLLPEERMQKK